MNIYLKFFLNIVLLTLGLMVVQNGEFYGLMMFLIVFISMRLGFNLSFILPDLKERLKKSENEYDENGDNI